MLGVPVLCKMYIARSDKKGQAYGRTHWYRIGLVRTAVALRDGTTSCVGVGVPLLSVSIDDGVADGLVSSAVGVSSCVSVAYASSRHMRHGGRG